MSESKDRLSRREFISTSTKFLAGAAVAASLSEDILAQTTTSAPASKPAGAATVGGQAVDNILAPRKLGRTGLVVPAGGYGAMITKDPQLAAAVFDKGFYFVHSAPGYTGRRSYEAVKELLSDKARRKKVVIALKIEPKEVDRDLAYFGLDVIDIIVPPKMSLEEISNQEFIDAAVNIRKSGKVKAIGWSCHADTVATLNFAAKEGVFDAALIGYKDQSSEFLEALKAAKAKGLGVFAMKFDARPNNTEKLATRLKWLFTTGLADCALLSFTQTDQIQRVLDMKLGKPGLVESSMLRMDRARQAATSCTWCGKCVDSAGRCPNGVAIPQIMRYDYYLTECGWAERGRGKYAALADTAHATACLDCGACEKACPNSLPVRRLLRRAHEILA